MAPSGMLRSVALLRTDVSEELSASFIRVTRIGELGTQAVTSNRSTLRRLLVTASVVPSSPILVKLMKEALSSTETSFFSRATWRNITEGAIHHSQSRENLKSYKSSRVRFSVPPDFLSSSGSGTGSSYLEVKLAIAKLRKYTSPGSD
jgi:hypothetical protein